MAESVALPAPSPQVDKLASRLKNPWALRGITERLLEACGRDWDGFVDYVEDRKGHDRRYSLNDDKIRAELGYAPHVDFAEGLAATVQWYRDNESWWRPLKEKTRKA